MATARSRVIALAAFAAAALLAGCGGDDGATDPGGGSASGEPVAVKVGVLPITAVAPVHVGIEQGFFREEGLDVSTAAAQGGAALVPAVVSGEYQFAYSNNVSIIQAVAEGLPLRIVSEGAQAIPDAPGTEDAILVREDSDIREPADLAGAKIGVNTVNNIGDVIIKTALESQGVDPATLEFVEIPFPDMVPAVEAGRVDAGWVVEPFVQAGEGAGLRNILSPFSVAAEELGGDLSIATYFTSDEYAQSNPEVVEGFRRAMERSFQYLQERPEELRRSVTTFTEIPEPVVQQMGLPVFTADLSEESIPFFSERMVRYGLIDEAPDPASILPSAG